MKNEEMNTDDIPIGIDLGTTYSCVGVYKNNKVEIIPNVQGKFTTPSVIAFSSKLIIGEEAKQQTTIDYKNIVYDTKRLIGRLYNDPIVQNDMKKWPFKVIKDEKSNRPIIEVEFKKQKMHFFPEDISALILKYMKTIADDYLNKDKKEEGKKKEEEKKNDKPRKAIITVPAYFNESQRQATKDAGRIAGLNVIRMINEPTSAALAYRLKNNIIEEQKVLVFDLGGGTFDVSILIISEEACEVKATKGDTHLGGGDFDNELMEYCIQEFKKNSGIDISNNEKAKRRLKKECEKAKINLSSTQETNIDLDSLAENEDFSITIKRSDFEFLCQKYFDKCFNCINEALKDSRLKKEQIDEVILVGGSSRIPKIQEMLKDYFQKAPNKSINPDEAVAYGAAYQAASIEHLLNEEFEQLVLIDVVPLSLGIAVGGEIMSVVVPRNTKIPVVDKYNIFETAYDFQEKALIKVYQGERVQVKDNDLLGKFQVEGVTKKKAGEVKFKINFNIDVNSLLTVTADEIIDYKEGDNNLKLKKSNKNLKVKEYRNKLSEDEIERRIEELNKLTDIQKEIDEAVRERVNLQMACQRLGLNNKLAKEYFNWSKKNTDEKKEVYRKKREEIEKLMNQ